MARILVYLHLDIPESAKRPCNQRRLWSHCADAQADLSLHWSHKFFYCRFWRALAHISLIKAVEFSFNYLFFFFLFFFFFFFFFLSSPEPKAQGEVLWSLIVRRRRPSVRPSTIFKQHLLLNHWLEFDQTSKEWSLVGPLSKLFKWFRSIAYLGHRS